MTRVLSCFIFCLYLSQIAVAEDVLAKEVSAEDVATKETEQKQTLEFKVAVPYIDVRTGPGRGFPVYHVIEKGQTLRLIAQRTDWLRVEQGSKVGWIYYRDLEKTRDDVGSAPAISRGQLDDFSRRRFEFGLSTGDFGGASLMSAFGNYQFSRNLALEASFTQSLSAVSDNNVYDLRLLHQAFPEWTLSPYMALGTGFIETQPHATLVQTKDRTDTSMHIGLGARWHVSGKFFLRLEYNNYVVFTSRDDNQEVGVWKAGFSAFF